MTTITTTSPAIQASVPAQTAASAPAPAVDEASTRPDAVVISLGKGTLSAVVHPFDTTAEQRVASLISDVKTHNDMADAVAQFDWASFAKDVGAEKANFEKSERLRYLGYSADRIGREFGESRIDVRPIDEKQAAGSGVAPGSVLVDSFSFEAGGSTYAVAAGEDGTLVGTRDGQTWKTWRITPDHVGGGAMVALSTLQTLLFGPKPSTAPGSGKGIDLVA